MEKNKVKQLTLDYKNTDENLFYAGSYDGLLESAGMQILSETAVGDYQGDLYVTLYDPDDARYGFTVIGYGSCGGCDAYESCYDNITELTSLRDSLVDGITWRESKEALSEWLVDRDHAGQWYCYDQEGWATACDDIGKALNMSEDDIGAMKKNGIRG